MHAHDLVFRVVSVSREGDIQVIAGQGTFNLLAIEELYRSIATGVPSAKFGIAFSEGSDARMLRHTGNDEQLAAEAVRVLKEINAGHYFVIFLSGGYPLQVINNIKMLSTTINIQVASGNEVFAIVADLPSVSAVLGFTDGKGPQQTEDAQDKIQRRMIIRKIGYLES